MSAVNILAFLLLFTVYGFAGNPQYDSIVSQARYYFSLGDRKGATVAYRNAFSVLGGGIAGDRYNNALAWSLCGNMDSAFFNLYRLQQKTDYLDPHELIAENRFINLHADERWQKLIALLNPNHEVYNDSLAKVLSILYDEDQANRERTDTVRAQYGWKSKDYQDLCDTIAAQDELDLAIVRAILDKYGWLSVNEVGKRGNSALWLVIQHASLAVQEKYYPIMELAVAKGKASRKNLAYLQDRILMREGKKQLYGTQYLTTFQNNETKLWDVEAPDSLNIRRESVGLGPMKYDK